MAQRKYPWQQGKKRTHGSSPIFGKILGGMLDAWDWIGQRWVYLQLPLTVLAVAHLLVVALFPAGSDKLMGIKKESIPGYVSMFQVRDAQGFYKTSGLDRFIMYKIYSQNGDLLTGFFPDSRITPRLRYDRWAMAGHRASEVSQQVHKQIGNYIIEQLPSIPLRMEMYSAGWEWDRNDFSFPWPGTHLNATLDLKSLGYFNGLNKAWVPAKPSKKVKK